MTQPEAKDLFFIPDRDPNFAYRWANTRDRRMTELIDLQGWEMVMDPPKGGATVLPPQVGGQPLGHTSEVPLGVGRRRGDLVLVRMPLERWQREVQAPKDEARKRQSASLDTMVKQANDQATRRLREEANIKSDRPVVFAEEIDGVPR